MVSEIPTAQAVVCGGSSRSSDELARHLSISRRLGDRIFFTGHVARPEAIAWKSAADVVVAPSRFEPFGLSVLEAMHCKQAIVASQVGGLAELVVHNETGILLPLVGDAEGDRSVDPNYLAAALIQCLTSAETTRTWGAAGQVRAEAEFSFQRFINGTVMAYEASAHAK